MESKEEAEMVDAGSEAGRDFTSFACIQKMMLDVFLAT